MLIAAARGAVGRKLGAPRTAFAPSNYSPPIRGPVLLLAPGFWLLTPSSLTNQIAHRQIDDLVAAAIEYGF